MARHVRTSALVLVLALALVPVLPLVAWGGGTTPATVRTEAYFGSDPWDAGDNTWAGAPTLPSVSRHQFRSLGDRYLYTADEDWFKVSCPTTGTPVTINVIRLGGQGGSYLDVYGSTGGSCDATSFDFAWPAGRPDGMAPLSFAPTSWWDSGMASMYFVAPHPGTYYFRHRPAVVDDVTGDLVATGPDYPRDATANVVKEAVTYELHVIVGDADRIAGNSRYNTAIAVTRQMWNAADDPWWGFEGPRGNGVILASGQNFADGLAATSFSLRSGMPILLTPQASLTPEVKAEIERLATGNWNRPWDGDNTFTVYICGSDAAISLGVEDALRADKYVTAVRRVEGRDRYATAVAIADETSATSLMRPVGGPAPSSPRPKDAFIINGSAWPDGLAAGPVAGFADAPVLMVQTNALPNVTRDWLVESGVERVHIVGGKSVVADSVMNAIASLPGTPTVDRIAGGSRYDTALAVARYGVDNYGMSEGGANVVSGESPWDALSAGQLSFMTYTPLLLTPRTSLSPTVRSFAAVAKSHGRAFTQPSYVVGGEPAVGAAAYNALRDLWKQ